MPVVTASHYPRTINQYVPNMEFAADVVRGQVLCNFGAPAALDADGIWDGIAAEATAATFTSADFKTTFDGSSTSLTSTSGMMDAPWGRCLTLVGSAGSDHVCIVTGRDYLGQLMTETFTLSGTVIQYGDKAFKFVDSIAVGAGAASDTLDVGWSDVLGLPYAAHQVLSWSEDNVAKEIGSYTIPIDIVDCVDADTVFGISNMAGFVTGMDVVTTVALGTGDAVLTVEIGGTAVAGLSVTVAESGSAIGIIDTDNAITWDQGLTSDIAAHSAIEVVSDGGSTTTGTVDCRINVAKSVLFVDAVTTDPQTNATGDPRGLIKSVTACDGSVEYEGVFEVNTSNLHGVAAV